MELLSLIVATVLFVGPFAMLSVLAIMFGVDSRPSISDDRSSRSPRWI